MLRNNTSIAKKLKRCRLNASVRCRVFSTTTSANKKSNPDSSPTLTPQTGQNQVRNIEDDGYGYNRNTNGSSFLHLLSSRFQVEPTPGTLILVRHGESEWNQKKLFTGWVDVDLSERGKKEIEHAARLLLERGYTIDIAYTSMLKRAIRSSWIILNEINQIYRPTIKSWRLNERMYGALEGLSKPELAAVYGEEMVQKWRSGLVDRPPPMTPEHMHYHHQELKYAQLPRDIIPTAESLQDTINRTIPFFESHILPDLKRGRNVLVVAHRMSIRGIVKHIDKIDLTDTQHIAIPNGIPLVYKFDKNMNPVPHRNAVKPLSGIYLEKKGLLRAALDREEELARRISGYSKPEDNKISAATKAYYSVALGLKEEEFEPGAAATASVTSSTSSTSTANNELHSNLIKSLSKLEDERKLINLVQSEKQLEKNKATVSSETNDMERKDGMTMSMEKLDRTSSLSGTTFSNSGLLFSRPRNPDDDVLERPLLVIIRHGKTEHNKLGLFTGWEDANLAHDGREEALHAGRVLHRYDIKFDVVYTSWLSRAIETAWLVMNELDSLWLPVVKTWRLNERMYGALTGLSKKMIKQIYGDEQFMKWRRGFDYPPPEISSFSHAYPGNDERYVNYVQDVEISLFETCIRSLAHGKLEVHRKFPKAESLKDCMDRTIPYFKNVIVPDSVATGKNVLIASSENAIRGLLKNLCDIPTDKIHLLEIPTGLPLVFDSRLKGIRLLDDGKNTATNGPLARYNFGDCPELLFKRADEAQPLSNDDILIRHKNT